VRRNEVQFFARSRLLASNAPDLDNENSMCYL
jgi:hypothetical protein